MTELKQNLKELESELSEMVRYFHEVNNIQPLKYNIYPVQFENKRAIGERLMFIKHDIHAEYPKYNKDDDYSFMLYNRIKNFIQTNDIQKEFRNRLIEKIDLFCRENDLTYVLGEINYVATLDNRILNVYTELLLKP